jgi:hypothetical protein
MKALSLKASRLGAFCLLSTLGLTPLLGGCAANYHFCPAGAAQDPSHPFAPCKTTAPAEPQGR